MTQGTRIVCAFCNLQEARVEIKNSLAMAFEDKYPVTEGHTLTSPLRHIRHRFLSLLLQSRRHAVSC